MNFDNFTIKSQEAIQKAVEIVRNHNEQSIEPVHLLKASPHTFFKNWESTQDC